MDYVPSHGNTAVLADRDNTSGLRAFDGEDQGQGNRVRMQQLQQADWIAQQTREKELFKDQQRFAEKRRDEEALANYELLKQTQVEHDAQRTAMFKATQQANLQMAQEKRNREAKEHQDLQEYGAYEQDFTMTHDFMTENPATEQSMLAAHRVKPYHFKGLNKDQQDAILHERAQQIREQKLLKETEKEKDRLEALQLEHMRRQQVLADRAMKKASREVAIGHRATQEQQRDEHKESWRDHYDEKTATHNNF